MTPKIYIGDNIVNINNGNHIGIVESIDYFNRRYITTDGGGCSIKDAKLDEVDEIKRILSHYEGID